MQKTLTIKGKTFTSKRSESLIDDNNKVVLNGIPFDVTYRIDEHNMFENTKRQDGKFMLLWGRGYKAAFSLPLELDTKPSAGDKELPF